MSSEKKTLGPKKTLTKEKYVHEKPKQNIVAVDLSALNDTVLCNAIIHLRNLVTPGNSEYKERIYEGQALLIVNEFHLANKNIKAALSNPNLPISIDSLPQEKLVTLNELIKKISAFVKHVHAFMKKLPEARRHQKYLSKLKGYKSDFAKFDKEILGLNTQLNKALADIGFKVPVVSVKEHEQNTAKAVEEDTQKLLNIFQKTRAKKYVTLPNMSPEEAKADLIEHQRIVQQQMMALKEHISPAKKADRGDRLDESLVVPSWELVFEEKLTDGTCGGVYVGTFRKQPVIIKTLEVVDEQEEKKLFNEIKTMVNVRSKYVTQLYGICWGQGFKCVIMEYMPKGSLYYNLGQQPLRIQEQKKLALEIAYGLYNLYAIGMVHGNLNSYNVLLNDANEPKLTDFSCAETRQVSLTSVKGSGKTPIESIEWMAPELFCLTPKRTHQSDIYSFGMILWEIFTGKHPFSDMPKTQQNYEILIEKVMNGLRESLENFPSPYIAAIIKSCWAKRSEDRPSIEEVMDQLESYKPSPKEEEQIVVSLKAAAEANNSQAQHNLALRYLKGMGIEKNPQAAYRLFLKSALGGYCFARIHVVIMNFHGIGTAVNKDTAIEHYQEALKEQTLIQKCPGMISQLSSLIFPPTDRRPSASSPTHQQGMFDTSHARTVTAGVANQILDNTPREKATSPTTGF